MARRNGNEEESRVDYYEQYDIPRATIGEIKEQMLLSLKMKQHRGVWCIVGDAGMGKSQIVHQVAEESGRVVCDIRTAHFGLMGAGIPSVKDAKSKDHFKIKLPEIFPKEGEKAIVFFDEINQGAQHAIALFFSVIEDRRMFNYFLPEDALVVAAMNPNTAQYAVTQIENNAALRRRLKWLYAIPSFKDWVKHAESDLFHAGDTAALGEAKPCHPGVLDYFTNKPDALDDYKARQENKQYTCPATLQTISVDAYLMEEENIPLYGDFAACRFSASIGVTAANSLAAYLKDNSVEVNPMDVLLRFKKVKKRVKRLAEDKALRQNFLSLNTNVITTLLTQCPDVDKVAPNFLDFLVVQMSDPIGGLMPQMKHVAKLNKTQDYLKKFMREIGQYDEWVEIHKRIDASHRSVDNDIR
jgi:hypothetical protein